MHVALAVPFTDTSASDLGWSFSAPPLPCLAQLHLTVAVGELELRVLGGSHQVLARVAGGQRCSEVVACGLAHAPGLPARRECTVGSLVYRFRSHLARLPAPAFEVAVASLVDRFGADATALVAAFPGESTAVTVVAADPTGVRWRTWHAYPSTGELVSTRTQLARR